MVGAERLYASRGVVEVFRLELSLTLSRTRPDAETYTFVVLSPPLPPLLPQCVLPLLSVPKTVAVLILVLVLVLVLALLLVVLV